MENIGPLNLVFIIVGFALILAPILSYFRLVSIQTDLRNMKKDNESAKKELEKQTQLLANILAASRSK
jgi:hypothetical protein